MKYNKSLIILSLSFFSFISCVDDSDNYNDDRDKPYEVPAESLLTNAQKSLVDQMTTPSVNLNVFRFFEKYWATTDYPSDAIFNFLGTRKVPDNHWTELYTDVLGDLESAKQAVASETKPSTMTQADFDKIQSNKTAIIDILQIYTFQILVDSFGDIPYSESLDPSNVLPKYDDDAEIYPQLIDRLNNDISKLDESYNSFSSGDYILEGDVSKWKLFANSLKIKLGINLADINGGLAKTTVEAAYNAGVIVDNSQNISFDYPSGAPNYNPIYANVIASGRNDYVGEETIINYMNNLGDSRISAYFTYLKNLDESPILDENGNFVYEGGILGESNDYPPSVSGPGEMMTAPDFPSFLFDAAEINFYLAEAAARGYSVGATPEFYYNAAITASFEQWNVEGISSYLSNPEVNYATAPGSWKQKIGMQAWVAMYNRGFESWNFNRRLDYPMLETPNAVPAAEGKTPTRMTYPIAEQTVNEANWTAASTAIGGDKLTTKIFWDVN